MNTIDPVVLNKIKYHIDSLKHLLDTNRVNIAVSASSGIANLLPDGYAVAPDHTIREKQAIVMADDFPQVDLPVILYDPGFESIVKIPD